MNVHHKEETVIELSMGKNKYNNDLKLTISFDGERVIVHPIYFHSVTDMRIEDLLKLSDAFSEAYIYLSEMRDGPNNSSPDTQ
jgi:hypothetical protein